ncbi:glycerol-3-phosphate 1-O-acyltransferase PlsY [Pseudalkalibacillus sp. Hm43]|uniref:glycerol-3-phosphate 1-O-acyltransferase PlsY n=1 Tax=Pseudalkalibacillus sp. Hm43 TaxID=3450742 RepID=UPI003F439058
MAWILLIVSYLIGSFSFSIWIGKRWHGVDVRTQGSGNAGATNTFRTFGKKTAILVAVGDVSKGLFAASLPMLFNVDVSPLTIGMMAVIGHCFPIYYGFKGGKAIAPTAGVLLVWNPIWSLIAYGVFFLVIFLTRYVFLGSISIGITLTILCLQMNEWRTGVFFIFFTIFLIYLHRSNIRNYWNRVEPTIHHKDVNREM